MGRPRVRPDWESGSDAEAHASAFVSALVMPKFRERLRAKPFELLDRLYHELEVIVDPRKVVIVVPATYPRLLPFIQRELRASEAVYLGRAYGRIDCGKHPIDRALDAVSSDGAAIASVLPGAFAYCRGELPYEGQFVLAADAAMRDRLRACLSKSERGP